MAAAVEEGTTLDENAGLSWMRVDLGLSFAISQHGVRCWLRLIDRGADVGASQRMAVAIAAVIGDASARSAASAMRLWVSMGGASQIE